MLREIAKRKRDRILLLTACHKTNFHRWFAQVQWGTSAEKKAGMTWTWAHTPEGPLTNGELRRVLKALSTASLLATVLSTAWFGRIRTYIHTYIHTYIGSFTSGKNLQQCLSCIAFQILKFSLHAAAPQDGVYLAKFI